MLRKIREICKTHLVEFEPEKWQVQCENCDLKDVCMNRKKPCLMSDEDIQTLEGKIKERNESV